MYNGTASMRDILHTDVTGAEPERAPNDLERLEDMAQGEKERTLIKVSSLIPLRTAWGCLSFSVRDRTAAR